MAPKLLETPYSQNLQHLSGRNYHWLIWLLCWLALTNKQPNKWVDKFRWKKWIKWVGHPKHKGIGMNQSGTIVEWKRWLLAWETTNLHRCMERESELPEPPEACGHIFRTFNPACKSTFAKRYCQTRLYLDTPVGTLLPRDRGQCVTRLEGQTSHYWSSRYPQPPKRETVELTKSFWFLTSSYCRVFMSPIFLTASPCSYRRGNRSCGRTNSRIQKTSLKAHSGQLDSVGRSEHGSSPLMVL